MGRENELLLIFDIIHISFFFLKSETVSTWHLPNPTYVTDNAANEKKLLKFLNGSAQMFKDIALI